MLRAQYLENGWRYILGDNGASVKMSVMTSHDPEGQDRDPSISKRLEIQTWLQWSTCRKRRMTSGMISCSMSSRVPVFLFGTDYILSLHFHNRQKLLGNIEQESSAIADKPARRESLPKMLQFDVPTIECDKLGFRYGRPRLPTVSPPASVLSGR